jgi:hypothetical protein
MHYEEKFPHKPLGISRPTNLSCLLRKTYNEFRRKQSNFVKFREIQRKYFLENHLKQCAYRIRKVMPHEYMFRGINIFSEIMVKKSNCS